MPAGRSDGSLVKLIHVSGNLSGTHVNVLLPEAYPDELPIVTQPTGFTLNHPPPSTDLLSVCKAVKAQIGATKR
jgi:hypothetical protein